MKHIESDIQAACVKWFDLQYSAFSLLLFHCPNEGRTSPQAGARLKRLGCRAGVPDLILLIPNGIAHGLLIEMKAPKGTLTESQRIYRDEVINQNYAYAVCRSLDEFIMTVKTYLK
jgi:hypothetical protein